MATVYLVCAVAGSVLVLCQLVMTLLGMGGDHDITGDHDIGGGDHGFDVGHHDFVGVDHGLDVAHHDFVVGAHEAAAGYHDAQAAGADTHGSSLFFGVLSFRALVAATAFFGLAGLGALESNLPVYPVFVIAVAAGAAAMFVVAWMMRLLSTLHAEGTVRIEHAVGEVGSVYLTVPGQRKGAGKVTVRVQDRSMEYLAVTSGDKLPTGTRVVVTGVATSNTLEVEEAKE